MKKIMSIFLLGVLLLSACQAGLDFQLDGDIGIDPDELIGEEEPDQQQEFREPFRGEWFTHPIVIGLLIVVVALVVLLVVSQARRPS